MNSFEGGQIGNAVSQNILRSVAFVGRVQGASGVAQCADAAGVGCASSGGAVVQSTESSNRIEGVMASLAAYSGVGGAKDDAARPQRAGNRWLPRCFAGAFTPAPPPCLLRPIWFCNCMAICIVTAPVTAARGKILTTRLWSAIVRAKSRVRFRPTAAWQTPFAMDDLHRDFEAARRADASEPLILIAAYVLDFLCIHPFNDGNGRMARTVDFCCCFIRRVTKSGVTLVWKKSSSRAKSPITNH